jgi:hypothetical protein
MPVFAMIPLQLGKMIDTLQSKIYPRIAAFIVDAKIILVDLVCCCDMLAVVNAHAILMTVTRSHSWSSSQKMQIATTMNISSN